MTDDAVRGAAEQFVRDLKVAMAGESVGDVAGRANMEERRLTRILARNVYPDLADIRSLEIALDADLWRWPHD